MKHKGWSRTLSSPAWVVVMVGIIVLGSELLIMLVIDTISPKARLN